MTYDARSSEARYRVRNENTDAPIKLFIADPLRFRYDFWKSTKIEIHRVIYRVSDADLAITVLSGICKLIGWLKKLTYGLRVLSIEIFP
jgi:hypothetical protein